MAGVAWYAPGVVLLVVGLLGVIWLAGLVIALRGAAPGERARIIAAYGRSFPWRR